uniref:Serine/arginine repetitive matrix 4 n=1 Tax=Oryzias latipes TaxID=8090 RepID=A0A3P9JNQ7_ORYLA
AAGKLGEKQLFEKFWKGTFKAVATPRPGSVIVASITARRRTKQVGFPTWDDRTEMHEKTKHSKSCCFLFCFSKPRSSSHSLPPLRKKKKKKKKSSKKSVLLLFVCLQILPSNPGKVLFNGSRAQNLPNCREGPHDYDSGNDTSSPPSSKTGVSQGSAAEYARTGRVASAFRDSASDSGNSVTSFASSCKPFGETSLSATLCNQISNRRRGLSRTKGRSSSSRSRSSGSSKYLGRYSRSSSLSSRSSYSQSPSHSDVRRRGSMSSLSSRGSYSRHTDSRETDAKQGRKVRKRGRRKSYTPMRKRRRDSPSHLEARRITSARKRPIPYFRPSPPSSIRSTSVSSWSSIFTRSRSPIHSISRSRSHSFSSYRSYSRSSSWNSTCGSRSRSRSRSLLIKRRKTRH